MKPAPPTICAIITSCVDRSFIVRLLLTGRGGRLVLPAADTRHGRVVNGRRPALDRNRRTRLSGGETRGMMMGKRLFKTAALLLVAAASVGAKGPVVGQPAPDFQVKLMDGSKVSLADLKGQVVVLNFWATWCGPCKHELPLLDTYYRVQKPHGLRVFAITTEGSVPLYALKNLFAALAITPIKGIKGPYNDLGAVPTNYIIDRKGVVRYAKAAAFGLDDLNRELVPLLEEPA
jgi:thiol-disulfide isomerase/thioredoxin